jgi:hypothetical protein
MAVRQHADRGAELHAPRPPGQPGKGGEGIVKRLGVTLAHVRRHGHVIGNHDGVVAEVLGEARPPAERVRARSGPEVEDIHADFHGRAPRGARGTTSASTATQAVPRGTTVISGNDYRPYHRRDRGAGRRPYESDDDLSPLILRQSGWYPRGLPSHATSTARAIARRDRLTAFPPAGPANSPAATSGDASRVTGGPLVPHPVTASATRVRERVVPGP